VSGPVLLLGHSLRRIRTVLIAMAVMLAAFQVMLVLVARSIDQSGGFRQLAALMPSFVRDLMGPSVTVFMSFGGIVCLGYFHLAVMGSLVGLTISIATTPTGEIESGFIDLLLARPLARHWIITRTVAVAMIATAGLAGVMVLGTWIGLITLAPPDAEWPSAALVRSLAVNLWLVLLCWSGVALAIGAAARRRSVAGGIAGLLALAAFLIDYVGRLWAPIESIAWLSPFRYFSPFDIVRSETVPGKNVAVLLGIAAAGFIAAYVAFARRDISH
jgi:ABC-2 type transport system permease protein